MRPSAVKERQATVSCDGFGRSSRGFAMSTIVNDAIRHARIAEIEIGTTSTKYVSKSRGKA